MRISDWSSDVCSSDLPDTGLSPRLAPPMLGLGLLAAIHQDDILAHAERDHGDGISGRPNWIKDSRKGERVLGRFNWKAGQPTVEHPSVNAFSGAMGLSQIGRASCRERVGQYVEIVVG